VLVQEALTRWLAEEAWAMANEEHLARLKEGMLAWNQWRKGNREVIPDLSMANLTGARLTGVDLSRVDLSRANLFGAHLTDTDLTDADLTDVDLTVAHLSGAHLTKADFTDANLTRAHLTGTDLTDADLTRAHLSRVDLTGARLSGAHLSRARIGWTTLGGIDLSVVHGLDTIIHEGPSTIGIDTLFRSHGNIPEVFLRGAGVPDDFITYIKSLVGRPFEYYSCFISYSSKDQEFASRLHADLQSNGVRCWFAPHDVQGGRKLHEQIDDAIHVHEQLLLILSAHSMNSEWVKTEIAKARQREVREKRQVLFPVRLVSYEAIREWKCFDADTGKDSAREIREYFIPDFSNWKNPDAYQAAFRRLLRDLKPNTFLL
jgi:TIR domain-containing protein/pentapeptide repeat protein